jgi:predicted enzyme related to lactoylglutathione lyase
MMLLTACMRNRITVPSVTENATGKFTYGRFIWHDLLTDDVATAKKFYQSLFGWEFKGRGGDEAPYLTAYNNNAPVCGIVKSDRLENDRSESRWIGYVSVPDVQRTVDQILLLQGIIFIPPRELSERGMVALAGDPWGAHFGVLTTWAGDPEEKEPEIHGWMWNELMVSAPDSMAVFYEEVFNYTLQENPADDKHYYMVLRSGDQEMAGISRLANKNNAPMWVSFIRVEELNTVIDQAQRIGGRILYRPAENSEISSAAIIADPTGAVFGIQEWP